jgi:hypothetical protein
LVGHELPCTTDRLSVNEFIRLADKIVDSEDHQYVFASVVVRKSIEKEGTVEEVEEGVLR